MIFTQKILSKNIVAIHEIKPVLTPDKPIYVGTSILDLCKLLMHEFHYSYIKRKYNANLLFTHTDSLFYEIETNDVYEDFYEDKSLFDFSDYPEYSKSFDPINNIICKMKDEVKGKIISEFVGLKSKMYSLVAVDNEEIKKAKGVNKNVAKTEDKEFTDGLFNKKMVRHKMKRVHSKLHRIEIYDVCKISLSYFDNKRYILGDGINSSAYFRKDVKS